MTYLALLRGINVGGNTLIKMADLRTVLTEAGLQNVSTYIQSGNVIFTSKSKDAGKLAALISSVIKKAFNHNVDVAVLDIDEWRSIIQAAPKWWGVDQEWRHDLYVLISPYDLELVHGAISVAKVDRNIIHLGTGVFYQSISRKHFDHTWTTKLVANPIYKRITIRGYNTTTKLLKLMEATDSATT
jgi:uncharacterized protein (DUF1697 family)